MEGASRTCIVNHFLQRHDIRVGALRLCLAPAQQDGEVEQGSGEGFVGLVLGNVHARMPLAQLLPVLIDEQADVGELGGLPAKGLVHSDVLGGGYQPFLGICEQGAERGTVLGGRVGKRTAPRMT